jgi:methyl-accepting chemotaxis protein
MSEETFRIVVTVAVLLACIAFIVQAGIALAMYFVARKMQRKVEPLVDRAQPLIAKAGPVIDKIGPMIDKFGPVAEKAGPAIEKAGKVIEKVGPVVDNAASVLATANRIVEENRPRVAEVAGDVAGIAKSGRAQVERLGELLQDAGDRARERLEQIDQSVGSTVEQVEHVGESVKRAVMKPVREVNGLAAGISAVVSTLVKGRKSSVDHATQDEEMFI